MSIFLATHRYIDTDTFVACYRPVRNHLDKTASLDFGEGGCLFSPAGKAFRFVLAQKPRSVWTVMDINGALSIESGLHLANRLGYLLTERSREDDSRVIVRLDYGARTPGDITTSMATVIA